MGSGSQPGEALPDELAPICSPPGQHIAGGFCSPAPSQSQRSIKSLKSSSPWLVPTLLGFFPSSLPDKKPTRWKTAFPEHAFDTQRVRIWEPGPPSAGRSPPPRRHAGASGPRKPLNPGARSPGAAQARERGAGNAAFAADLRTGGRVRTPGSPAMPSCGWCNKVHKPLFFLIIPDISPVMLSASSESDDK